jgi:hypothetical protein
MSAEVAVEAAKTAHRFIAAWRSLPPSHGAVKLASFAQISDAEETYLSRQMTNILSSTLKEP